MVEALPRYSSLLFLSNPHTEHLSHFNLKHPMCHRSAPESLKNDTTWLRGQAKGSAGNLCWQPAQTAPLFALTVSLTSPTEPFAPQLF